MSTKKTSAQLHAERILGRGPKPADGRPTWERHAARLRQAAGVGEPEQPQQAADEG